MEDMLVAAGKKDSPLLMSDVNYAEVKYSIVKKDGAEPRQRPRKGPQGLPIDFIPRPARWPMPQPFQGAFQLSLADAFAAALAKENKTDLVTGNPKIKPLEKEIKDPAG